MTREHAAWKPGMMYAIPLPDGRYGVAQAIEAMMSNAIYVAVFRHIMNTPSIAVREARKDDVVSLIAVVKSSLKNWRTAGVVHPAVDKASFPNETTGRHGYIGAKVYDAGIVADFVAAFHGIRPWNVMKDENYFDHLLAPDVSRPAAVVVLSPDERRDYRTREFGVE